MILKEFHELLNRCRNEENTFYDERGIEFIVVENGKEQLLSLYTISTIISVEDNSEYVIFKLVKIWNDIYHSS